jgi:serine/threonine protein phosphatase PrpC
LKTSFWKSKASALEMASASDTGRVRDHNEDSVAVDVDYGLALLADGMGGYNAGEIASGITVALLMQGLKARLTETTPTAYAVETLVREEVAKANSSVYHAAHTRPQCAGMGTTLVLAVFHDNQLISGHIGDSRLYRLRDGQFTQLTRDHSLLQEQIDQGILSAEAAAQSYNKCLVTRALGMDPEVEVEVSTHPVVPDDIYLLCSDGLTDMASTDDIRDTLDLRSTNLAYAAQALIKLANDHGGRDNISVALVQARNISPRARVGRNY